MCRWCGVAAISAVVVAPLSDPIFIWKDSSMSFTEYGQGTIKIWKTHDERKLQSTIPGSIVHAAPAGSTSSSETETSSVDQSVLPDGFDKELLLGDASSEDEVVGPSHAEAPVSPIKEEPRLPKSCIRRESQIAASQPAKKVRWVPLPYRPFADQMFARTSSMTTSSPPRPKKREKGGRRQKKLREETRRQLQEGKGLMDQPVFKMR
ncbi:hypothetical protein ETB97_001703 [Aspergillus alliaceus]|uniref:Uncharacterized protein n=1 Tax=Petromyces alliaceus TaxID=209559 RepID=A0A8H6E6J3_PETAA|nr:hypothetical protein ETB97_001703 [Aspergillus burnettii]